MISQSPIVIERLDHFVLTVKDLERTIRFYEDILGMEAVTFGSRRRALQFGRLMEQKSAAGAQAYLQRFLILYDVAYAVLDAAPFVPLPMKLLRAQR